MSRQRWRCGAELRFPQARPRRRTVRQGWVRLCGLGCDHECSVRCRHPGSGASLAIPSSGSLSTLKSCARSCCVPAPCHLSLLGPPSFPGGVRGVDAPASRLSQRVPSTDEACTEALEPCAVSSVRDRRGLFLIFSQFMAE